MGTPEPGLYLAQNTQGGPMGVMYITDAGTSVFHHIKEAWCGAVAPSFYNIGPRIPTLEQIEEQGKWVEYEKLTCPSCGGMIWKTPVGQFKCNRCNRIIPVDIRYRIREDK